ncbi:MAG: putative DNA base hypermodification protein [Gammaproteobacteria bacterium]
MLLEPTPVYSTFWQFAYERQEIFEKRKSGYQHSYTEDPILLKYKFTNAYRAIDRVSQFLIRDVIYPIDWSFREQIFRTLLFKLFNKISTWNLLENELGSVSFANTPFDEIDRVLTIATKTGGKIYSGAYIMPSGKTTFGFRKKHKNNLELLALIMKDKPDLKIARMKTFRELYCYLAQFPTIGPFLAYQYATDINYGPHTSFSESEFVVPGPGAVSGIHKCFKNIQKGNEARIISLVCEQQQEELESRGLNFKYLGSRKLQFIDIQNLFCEIDKYARIAHPEIQGISKRTRIKQLFIPTPEPIEYYFPPKWSTSV